MKKQINSSSHRVGFQSQNIKANEMMFPQKPSVPSHSASHGIKR